jgi:glycerol uptake facilitator-like aquaporin
LEIFGFSSILRVSGAQFNPAVTLVMLLRGEIKGGAVLAYVTVQIAGGCLGAVAAHLMFGLDPVQLGSTARTGVGQWIGEFIATFGLIAAILGCVRFRPDALALAVGLYITSTYWFTSSTSFANPAVTVARALSNTFAGIAPGDAPGFIVGAVKPKVQRRRHGQSSPASKGRPAPGVLPPSVTSSR